MSTSLTIQQIVKLVRTLPTYEQCELVKLIATEIQAVNHNPVSPSPLQSAYGICADLQPAPSSADIAEVRQEIFHEFPREDFNL
jgi:hypothetical protein